MPAGKQLSDMILEVRLGSHVLSQGMLAYLDREGVLYLPLGDYTRLLDFPIRVDPEAQQASGWFLRESRLFSLNLRRDEVIVDGHRMPFAPASVRVIDHDIFVDVRLLARWFPVDIKFDLANLLVELTSREPLPLEQRLARQAREKRVLSSRRSRKKYPAFRLPYRWIGWPSVDTSLEYTLTGGKSGVAPALSHSTLAAADIGKMHGNVFVAGNHADSVSTARVTLSRQDFDGKMFGPLGATRFAVGDIVSPQVPLISSTNLGRGVTLSTFPLNRTSEFDRTTLEGDLNTGWEVELYRNETLLDFQQAGPDGRYRFENVPLLFGVNTLRLVFYGPQGQVREQTREIRVGADQVAPSAHDFRFSVNQDHRTLFDPGGTEAAGAGKDFGHDRWSAEYLGGVTRNLSIAGYGAGLTIDGQRHTYLGAGARMSLGDVYGRLDLAQDIGHGPAVKAAAQTSVLGTSLSAEYNRFLSGYVSEQTGSIDDPLTQSESLRWDGVVGFGKLLHAHVPFNFTNTHEVRQSGASQTFLENRLSTSIGRLNLTNRTAWRYQESGDDTGSAAGSGSFLAGGRVGELRLRSVFGYDWLPRFDLTSATLQADWRIDPTYNAEAAVSTDLAGSTGTRYTLGLNGNYPLADLGFKVDYTSGHDFAARLTLSFSLAKDPRSSRVHMRSDRLAGSGLVSVRAYRDVNANGTFDAKTDKPLAGVAFTEDGFKARTTTDKDGVALIDGLDTDHPIDFALDVGSLKDPFAVPARDGVSLALHPGVPATLDFPVITTGEIDGTVYRQGKDWSDPVSDAKIQLVDAHGKVVKETRSAYDGYYLFSFVPPGEYEIRADPRQVRRLNLGAPPPQFVKVGPDGDIVSGQDLVYHRRAAGTSDATRAGGRTYRVLLAIFAKTGPARTAWQKLRHDLPQVMKGLSADVETASIPGRRGKARVLYATGLPSRRAAETLCTAVRRRKGASWCNPLLVEMRSGQGSGRPPASKESPS